MKHLYLYFFMLLFFSAVKAESLIISTGFNNNEAAYLKMMTQKVFDRVGMDLEFQRLPNKRSLLNANNGISDGEAARIWTINKSYPNLIPVAPNIHKIDIVLISKKHKQIKKLSELHAYTIGLVRGVKISNILAKKAKPKAIIQATSYTNLTKMLIDERVDFVIVNKIGFFTNIEDMKEQVFYMRKEPLEEVKVYMQLHKKHKNLLPRFQKAFESLHDDGTYQKSYDTFMKKIMDRFSQKVKVVEYD